jgi:uncharacterized membrane protein YebE (DUF533 family)
MNFIRFKKKIKLPVMYSNEFVNLRKAYETERNLEFSNEQFAALLYTFPAVMVANADGLIDRKERNFIKHLPNSLISAYMDSDSTSMQDLSEDYFKEVDYLVYNIDQWKARFIKALAEELNNSLNNRNDIFRSMWQTADSSDDISEPERKVIDDLSAQLAL